MSNSKRRGGVKNNKASSSNGDDSSVVEAATKNHSKQRHHSINPFNKFAHLFGRSSSSLPRRPNMPYNPYRTMNSNMMMPSSYPSMPRSNPYYNYNYNYNPYAKAAANMAHWRAGMFGGGGGNRMRSYPYPYHMGGRGRMTRGNFVGRSYPRTPPQGKQKKQKMPRSSAAAEKKKKNIK